MYMQKRRFSDRRSGKDRRRFFNFHRIRFKGSERRSIKFRRSQIERRDGWVRIDKWSSAKIKDLKIARYLQ